MTLNHNPGLSRFQECTLGQDRIEEHLLRFIRNHGNVKVQWGTVPTSIQIDEERVGSLEDNPIEVKLKPWQSETIRVCNECPRSRSFLTAHQCNGSEPEVESSFKTKYVIGCDGARSWVRNHFGLSLEGESTNENWGVIDCIPVTDFRKSRRFMQSSLD